MGRAGGYDMGRAGGYDMGRALVLAIALVFALLAGLFAAPVGAVPGSINMRDVLLNGVISARINVGDILTIHFNVNETGQACVDRDWLTSVEWGLNPVPGPPSPSGFVPPIEAPDGLLDGCPSNPGDIVDHIEVTVGWPLGNHVLCVRASDSDDTTPWDDMQSPPENSCALLEITLPPAEGPEALGINANPDPVAPGDPNFNVTAYFDDTNRGGQNVVAGWLSFDDPTSGCNPLSSIAMTAYPGPPTPDRFFYRRGLPPPTVGTHTAYFWGEDSDSNCTGDGTSDLPGQISFTVAGNAAPIVSNVAVTPNPAAPFDPINVTANADDTMTGNNNVSEARVSIDGGMPMAMSAADGAFGEPVEDVYWASIANQGIGPHNVCVEAMDDTGLWSPPECVIFTITIDSTPPAPPTNLWANLANGPGWNDVTLTWTLSVDTGTDVDHQNVCYGNTYDGTAASYITCVTLGTGINTYTYVGQGDGDPLNYFYVVEAEDAAGNGAFSNQAGKFTRQVTTGRHLVSTPLVQQNTDVTAVFRTLVDQLDAAQTYVCTDSLDPWKSWVPARPYRDFNTMDHRMGAWVKVRNTDSFTTAGQVPTSTNVAICAGYSMIGFPSFDTAYTAADFKLDTGATRVQTSNPAGNGQLVDVPDGSPMLAGNGYWVRAPAATTWTIGQP